MNTPAAQETLVFHLTESLTAPGPVNMNTPTAQETLVFHLTESLTAPGPVNMNTPTAQETLVFHLTESLTAPGPVNMNTLAAQETLIFHLTESLTAPGPVNMNTPAAQETLVIHLTEFFISPSRSPKVSGGWSRFMFELWVEPSTSQCAPPHPPTHTHTLPAPSHPVVAPDVVGDERGPTKEEENHDQGEEQSRTHGEVNLYNTKHAQDGVRLQNTTCTHHVHQTHVCFHSVTTKHPTPFSPRL